MKTPAEYVIRRVDAPFLRGVALRRIPAITACLALCLAGFALGQDTQPPEPSPPPAQEAPPLPEPDPVDRTTGDGLVVRGTFFPSTQGKNAVPVILLHSWKGDGRKEFEDLARFLQAQGLAVLVPDLRGHGQSTTFKGGGATLDLARMGPADVSNMVTEDMEAWRGFLVQKNNEEALNLNKLCLVGSEMGASVAMHWALRDWNWLAWSAGKRKPSVKALVLLSPQRRFMGLDIRDPLANPAVRSGLSVMILVGKQDSKAYTQANQLYTSLLKYHPQPPAGLNDEALARWDEESRDLFFRALDTKLEGSKTLLIPTLRVPERIALFIDWRLVRKNRDFPWQEIGKKQ